MSSAVATGGVDVAGPSGFAACERRIVGPGRAVLAVVGASFTAGIGPDSPRRSWAVRLAGMLGWNAVILGDPGAGYARRGLGHEGPARRLLEREHLAALRPALVIVQFGYDDIGVPAAVERRQVRDTIGLIRAQAPRARIALVTVFTAGRASAAATLLDRVIVSSATAADPDVIIGDPLRQGWVFAHAVRGGLHPSAAGDQRIASIMDRLLRAHGVRPAASVRPAPLVCAAGLRRRPASVARGVLALIRH
jgi:lysophospholipase L1-like esterase